MADDSSTPWPSREERYDLIDACAGRRKDAQENGHGLLGHHEVTLNATARAHIPEVSGG
jgi:hypothetical protein